MNINKYKHDDWIVYFSGDKWSPLGFSSWISLYTRKPFSPEVDYFVKQAVLVWDGGTTTCYIRESEREVFGKKIVNNVLKIPNYIDFICEKFRSSTDVFLSIYSKRKKDFKYKEYADYNYSFLNNYYPYHIQVKNVVDFLPKEKLDAYLPRLQSVRIHAEPVFSQEVGFMKKIAKFMAEKTGYKSKNILFSLVDELTAYWRDNKKLPSEKFLEERSRGCVIFFEKGKIQEILVGKDIAQFSSIFENKKTKVINGQTAFGGLVRGVARIVFDPSKVKEFNKGDILIAPWTRPEYLPIMKKAAAFVTDGGGILSHAAIIARELKKPCVIATKNATQLLKNGDLIEVDADTGIVRKLS